MKKWIIGLAGFAIGCFLLKGLMALLFYGNLYGVDAFQIFYGKPDQQKLEELAQDDAAIIEATAFSKEQVSFLQKEDVLVFGYVSLMQLENWNGALKKNIVPSDYWMQDGEPLYVADWDTYVMDIREQHYREVLLSKIHSEIAEKQLDGVFFDTVDDLDYYFHEDVTTQKEMRAGYELLLDTVRSAYPDLLIIQNRGFDSYKTVSRKKIDGILWEGYDKQDLEKSAWAQNWQRYLKKEQRFGRVRVFTVVTDEASFLQSQQDHFPAFLRTGNTYQ